MKRSDQAAHPLQVRLRDCQLLPGRAAAMEAGGEHANPLESKSDDELIIVNLRCLTLVNIWIGSQHASV